MRSLPRPPLRSQPGLLRRILAEPGPVLDELTAAHGPIVGFGAGPVRGAIIGDPTALRELFGLPLDRFRWGHRYNVLKFVVGSGSMLVADGDVHKRRRSSVQSAFSRRRLLGWAPMIVERTDAAIDALVATLPRGRDGAVVDLYRVGRGLVLEIVVRALFGERLAARAGELGDLFQRAQDYLEGPALSQLPHPFPATRRARVRSDIAKINSILDEHIAAIRRAPGGDPLDVLEALVVDGALSDDEIKDQVRTLMGAGFDTTSATLSWMFWCCALAPGVWARLRAEADAVYGPVGDPAMVDDSTLGRLDLANRVMRETTRLHPAGVVAPRMAAVDIDVAGFRIKKGTLVLPSAHVAGRNPVAWVDPLRFDPDRFVDPPEDRRALADLAWVPFSRGARNCIGFALAQMELTLIVARLAQRLDVGATTTTMPNAVGLVVNRPVGGAPMHVRPRA
jgi:cytochrome P450